MVEGIRIVGEEHSDDAIDRTMLNFGMPMGPLRLTDEVGLEVSLHVGSDLAARVPHLQPINNVLPRMTQKGWLGKKSGEGFYAYRERSEMPHQDVTALQRSMKA